MNANAPSGDTPAGSIPGRTILIVDDDFEMRDVLSYWLTSDGFTAVSARHGAEALDLLLDGCRPDVILLDLMMPVMDGWTFLREQHLRNGLAAIPVIIVSAIADPTVKWPPSVAAVVPKPCNFDLLFEYVRSVPTLFNRRVGTA